VTARLTSIFYAEWMWTIGRFTNSGSSATASRAAASAASDVGNVPSGPRRMWADARGKLAE